MSLQSAARAFSRPAAPSTMTSSGTFRPRLTRSSRSARQAASLSPPMFLDRQQHLLAVLPDAQRHEKRNRRVLLVEPDAHNSAIENETDDRLVLQGACVPSVPIAFHL